MHSFETTISPLFAQVNGSTGQVTHAFSRNRIAGIVTIISSMV